MVVVAMVIAFVFIISMWASCYACVSNYIYIYIYVDVTLGRKCVYFSVKFEIAQIKEFKQI